MEYPVNLHFRLKFRLKILLKIKGPIFFFKLLTKPCLMKTFCIQPDFISR